MPNNNKRKKFKKTSLLFQDVQAALSKEGYDNFDDADLISQKEIPPPKELIFPLMPEVETSYIHDKVVDDIVNQFRYSGESVDSSTVGEALQEHLIHDIFALHYFPVEDITLLGHNEVKRELLISLVDNLGKIITEENYVSSYFFTKEISKYIYKLLQELNPDERQRMIDALSGKGNSEDADKMLKKLEEMLKATEGELEEALQKAKKDSDDAQELGSGKEIANLEYTGQLSRIKQTLKAISASRTQFNKFFKRILKESSNYFNTIEVFKEESLIDSDTIEELLDIHYLLDPLSNYMVHELTNRTKKSKGKVTLYVDASGSMGEDTYPGSRITLAKALSVKLMNLGYVDKVHFFSGRVHEAMTTPMQVITANIGGGTSFNSVLEHAAAHNNNSIVITDGDDYNMQPYLKKVYWIGIENREFQYFRNSNIGNQFIRNNQCLHYDGKDFKRVSK